MSIELTDITSGYSTGVINANFQKIQTEWANLLKRDNLGIGEANQLELALDANSNDILNVGLIQAQDFQFASVSGQSLQEVVDEAYHWAQYPEDALVPEGDLTTEYSAYHYSLKAGDSAVAALASEDASATSESNAATSESNAAASESNAAATLEEFEDQYWGAYASEPATSPSGAAATTGDLYVNTTDGFLYLYLAGAWKAISDYVSRTDATGSAVIPSGTDAQRDSVPLAGYLRFNEDTGLFEGYNGTAWASVGAGATGSAGDQVFVENDQVVTSDYTIPADKNAMSTGPITINDGITVTISDGARWVIL